jgi:hypothetical protein
VILLGDRSFDNTIVVLGSACHRKTPGMVTGQVMASSLKTQARHKISSKLYLPPNKMHLVLKDLQQKTGSSEPALCIEPQFNINKMIEVIARRMGAKCTTRRQTGIFLSPAHSFRQHCTFSPAGPELAREG